MKVKEPAPTRQFELHPAQKKFCSSNAIYRCLCGGIGSGKSYVGSYDLIRRAKPGRLYLVAAPTFTMLADSTFRSFLQVSQSLGLVNPGDVKRSPPAIKLRTGAEVLFRSADDPERLRGPNLSGCWLDEASLMPIEAFNVCIGRLRESGEQGWLSATFTPKGKTHWTYKVFGSGRKNTFIQFCETGDNPFLPEDFASNVGAQYTSRLARQELKGEFVDFEGGLFKRAWFEVVERASIDGASKVRAWDLAATQTPSISEKKTGNLDPDYTVGALMSKAPNGVVYIESLRRLRESPHKVEQMILSTAEADGKQIPIWFEQEPGAAGVTVIDHYAREVLFGYNFRAERSTGDKAMRAEPFAAHAEKGLVKLVRGAWNEDFFDEIEVFPFGDHDDQVDACALGFNKLATKKKLWFRIGGETF